MRGQSVFHLIPLAGPGREVAYRDVFADLHREARGVRVASHIHPALVSPHVIHPVGDRFPDLVVDEVMDLNAFLRALRTPCFAAVLVEFERCLAALGNSPADQQYAEASVSSRESRAAWARLMTKVYEADPLGCGRCGPPMRVVAVITEPQQVR
jgi:hypothetical protein